MSAQPSRRILFVNQHYWPDVASTGQHLTDLAEHLASEGFDVEVVCGKGKYLKGQVEAPDAETHNGVRIRRVKTTAFGRGSHLGRIIDYASYYVQVLVSLLTGEKRDGVVFLTTPPLLAFVGAIARVLRGQRYAVWSMDLHPDAEIASGMIARRNPLAIFLEWANRVGYRFADFVIDLGQYMKERIVAKGVSPQRTHTVHVWSTKEEIVPTPRDENPVVQQLGLADKFVVMYSGNAGVVHDFRDILEAIRLLKGDPKIHFLFVGNGPRRKEIERFAAEHAIGNFQYRDYFPREQLKYSLSVADAHFISLRAPFVGISVPGKLYGIMASARPALFVGPERCESAETIRSANCGVVVDPDQGNGAERIVAQLRSWAENPEAARTLGAFGREAFLAQYEREPNVRQFTRIVRQVWGGAEERSAADVELGEPAVASAR